MTVSGSAPIDLLVDFEVAARTAARVARPGPAVPPERAAAVVDRLRRAAAAAGTEVTRVSGLQAPPGPPAMVVDRAGWARLNAGSFRGVLEPVVAEAFGRRGLPPAAVAAVGSTLTGVEVGALLGVLSSRVLGQFDPFGGADRLFLVAPNVVRVVDEMDVDEDDFATWVCLHEETHRVQFGATPWLADHLVTEVRTVAADLVGGTDDLGGRLVDLLRSVPETLRGTGTGTLLDPLQTEEQRERLARVTAVMSLLEGHADVVMDAVGPEVVPSVVTIRRRFDRRRAGRGPGDRVLRRLLGLDAKLRQYADGARFVRGVRRRVGTEGLNAVWTSPETLPLPEEISEPGRWVRRVHG